MWGYIGEVAHEEFLLGKSIQGARVYLYTHLHFTIGFNNDQIVTANVTTDPNRRLDITDGITGQEIDFSYSVEWVSSSLSSSSLSSSLSLSSSSSSSSSSLSLTRKKRGSC